MFRFSSPFLLDLRSIALFRVGLGAIMLYDVMARLPYARLFLSDEGALSRVDLLAVTNRPWSFSVYMMLGEPSQVQVALLVHAIAALALVFGLWTRIASVVCWVMLVSLQHRNPLVLNGGDTLLAVYAFWAMFLPLNRRFSLDRLWAEKREVGGSNAYHAVPGAALVMQTVLVYLFTWLLKSGDLWKSGETVGYVIRNGGLIKEGGLWFQQFEGAHATFTWLTYHWEWIGIVLVLFPLANGALRLIAVSGFVAMHLGFGWMLDLALFPAVSIVGWLALLPNCLWCSADAVAERLGASAWRSRVESFVCPGAPFKAGSVALPGRAAGVCCAVAIGLIFLWNMRSLPELEMAKYVPQPVENATYALKIRQKWSMFAANPPRHWSWYAIEAQLANGDTVDLFAPDRPYSLRRPELFTDRLPDRRWGKFLGALKKKRYQRLRDDFLGYLVERWNAEAPQERIIEKASLVYFREPISWGVESSSRTETAILRTLYPRGVVQVRDSLETVEEDEQDGEDL